MGLLGSMGPSTFEASEVPARVGPSLHSAAGDGSLGFRRRKARIGPLAA